MLAWCLRGGAVGRQDVDGDLPRAPMINVNWRRIRLLVEGSTSTVSNALKTD